MDSCLLLDLETTRDGRLRRIGAVLRGQTFERKGHFNVASALAELDTFAASAERVLGHNLLGHDLPFLDGLASHLQLLRKPVVDTLYLSPLAFPKNPYHPLIKHYKDDTLLREAESDPVADAQLAARAFVPQAGAAYGRSATYVLPTPPLAALLVDSCASMPGAGHLDPPEMLK